MKSEDRKKGESAAMQILQAKGIAFDNNYRDDGTCGHSIADLKYTNGRYLEVTHTYHDNSIVEHPRKAMSEPLEKRIKRIGDVTAALERQSNGYRDQKGSEDISEQIRKDQKLIDNYFGVYDPERGKRSERRCDQPIIECSVDNILYEVEKDKGKKYTDGQTDLFIFVLQEEYEIVMELLKQTEWNGSAKSFMARLYNSPFPVIYLCVWDFYNQQYIDNPQLCSFTKQANQTLRVERLNKEL